MTQARIQPKAVAVCWDGPLLLVERGRDRVSGTQFYRPIGGAVEFCERAGDAVAREWLEEFGLRLESVRLLGVLENLFVFEGVRGHEIVFVFEGRLSDPAAARLSVVDSDGQRHEADWVTLADLKTGEVALYPTGLLPLLEDSYLTYVEDAGQQGDAADGASPRR